MELDDTARCLEALGNPTRLELFRLLVRAGPGGAPVGRLQEATGVPASTLTHHLKKLMIVGLIEQERRGRSLICRAVYERMNSVVAFLTDQCCADAERCAHDETRAVRAISGSLVS